MARSYEEIMAKLKQVEEANPDRFKRFFDKEYLLLTNLQPGHILDVEQVCKESSRELFYDIAELMIIDELRHRDVDEGILEFNENKRFIQRTRDLRRKVFERKVWSPN